MSRRLALPRREGCTPNSPTSTRSPGFLAPPDASGKEFPHAPERTPSAPRARRCPPVRGLRSRELMNMSYSWAGTPFPVLANGGTRDGSVIVFLQGQGAYNSPVALRAVTAASQGDDHYKNAAYAFTFTLTDPDSGQSHVLQVTGQFNGTVTSSRVKLSNTFTGGSGSQTFDFLGREFTVTFGYEGAPARHAHVGRGHHCVHP